MKLSIFFILNILFLALPIHLHSQVLEIVDIKKKYEPYICKVEWMFNKSNVENIKYFLIYVEEGINKDFPNNIVDTLDNKTRGWQSEPREEYIVLDKSFRHFKNWNNKKIFTSGYSYTVGVEMVYFDSITRMSLSQREKLIILPFELISYDNIPKIDNHKINPQNYEILPMPFQIFISKENNNVFFVWDTIKSKIISISEVDKYIYCNLDNNLVVKYNKPPKRALPAGDLNFIVKTLGIILFLFFLISISILFISLIKALNYYNLIKNNSTDCKKIINKIVENEKLFLIIIYLIVSIVRGNYISKIISKLISNNTVLDFEINSFEVPIINSIQVIYSENSILNSKMIKNEIIKLLQST